MVDKYEFNVICKRLNWKLSEHRINEIFTQVKGQITYQNIEEAEELNKEEFVKAMTFIED